MSVTCIQVGRLRFEKRLGLWIKTSGPGEQFSGSTIMKVRAVAESFRVRFRGRVQLNRHNSTTLIQNSPIVKSSEPRSGGALCRFAVPGCRLTTTRGNQPGNRVVFPFSEQQSTKAPYIKHCK